MAFLDNIFEVTGRIGRTAYQIDSGQSTQAATFNEVVALSYVNPAWIANLSAQYDSAIRQQSTTMGVWQQAAQTILLGMVAGQDPFYGTSLSAALSYILQLMIAGSKTVKTCTITESTVADTANVGTGVVFCTLIRGDGLIFQNTVAEVSTLLITSDSYTGGATVGQEPWSWSGAANLSSLATGTPVGLWDWDWPQGSGASASASCIDASQDNTPVSGNYLTNSDFQSWTTGGTPILNNWHLTVGTWGTDILQETGTVMTNTTYSVKFVAGATLTALTTQFNSAITDGTLTTAGTVANITAFTGYAFNFWLKASGVISGGVLKVDLVDGSGTVINDQAGTANTYTLTLSTVTTSWVAYNTPFRLPVILPSIVRVRIRISTALAGASLYMSWGAFSLPTNLYSGGPNLSVFSNPQAPFEANPDPDGFTLTFTNNRGGASYGATFQTLWNRLYQTPGLILPYSGSPSYADSLITNS